MRRPSCSVAQRNEFIVDRIKALKADHPFWGYRRVWARLKYDEHINVNKKRVLRLMRRNDLLVKPNLRLKAKRPPSRSKPRAVRPNDWWGIDMTKVLVQSYGWVYIVLVLDWYTKKIIGYYAGRVNRTLKEELVWLREWDSPFVFVKELQNWIEVDYNQRHRHQTLGHQTPAEFEAKFNRQNAPALS